MKPAALPEDAALDALSAISNATRLGILRALVEAGPDGLAASSIAQKVGATPSRASFHLATMAEAGLVTSERRSREIRYRVEFSTLGALIRYLIEDCCKGAPALRACC